MIINNRYQLKTAILFFSIVILYLELINREISSVKSVFSVLESFLILKFEKILKII